MREGGRLKERERSRERRGSETDVPKFIPTMTMKAQCCMYVCLYVNLYDCQYVCMPQCQGTLVDEYIDWPDPLTIVAILVYFNSL